MLKILFIYFLCVFIHIVVYILINCLNFYILKVLVGLLLVLVWLVLLVYLVVYVIGEWSKFSSWLSLLVDVNIILYGDLI